MASLAAWVRFDMSSLVNIALTWLRTEPSERCNFWVQGNYDRLSQTYCEANGVTLIKNSFQVIQELQTKLIFSHRPIIPLEDGWINLHGHIHNVPPPPEGPNLGPNHINMSVEVREYRPWKLKDIINHIA